MAYNTTGSFNSAVGQSALVTNTTGSSNTAMGYQAIQANTTASNNTAVGYQAGYGLTTGANNVCIGYSAGYYSAAWSTGSNGIYIGYNSGASSGSVSNEIVLAVSSVGKGASTAFIGGPNGVYQANNSTLWTVTSDQRLKKNIVDNNNGLEIIKQIQVRNFEYRLPEEITDVPKDQAIKKQGIQLGVIAQELQQVLPECVKTESTGVMTVNADNLTWYMVNAIKELKSQLDSVKAELATLKGA